MVSIELNELIRYSREVLLSPIYGYLTNIYTYEFRRFIEENILAYSVAINLWLREEPIELTWIKNARYVSKGGALRIAGSVQSFLGEKNEVKEWLAACLLKTVKDNQRWHKRTELIDDFPEVTSYFRETPRASKKLSITATKIQQVAKPKT